MLVGCSGYRTRMQSDTPQRADTVVLDVDGTLVDSNYHHVRAWAMAFNEVGRVIPEWRIHRAIGMTGELLVSHLAGVCTERAAGDEIRKRHDAHYAAALPQVEVLPGGHQLISSLKQHGFRVVAASSGSEEQTRAALEKIDDARDLDAWVSGDQVGTGKPAPELLEVALSRAEGTLGVAVGDSVWDMRAAGVLGWRSVGLRCGGFSEDELVGSGADVVHDDPDDLIAHVASLTAH